jgi:hypothetical protein
MVEVTTADSSDAEVQQKPWRCIGYGLFPEWSVSSDDFIVCRSSSIDTRLILRIQWEISKLENELSEMDKERMFEIDQDVNNEAFDYDDEDRGKGPGQASRQAQAIL